MARPWRVADSLQKLLDEINTRSPRRSKASDGAIGDAAHATRDSDHNPWVIDGASGVVTARDFTDDPEDGFDASSFADWLRARCAAGTENRVKYIISDRRIASSRDGWAWRKYSGVNAHTKHVHVSVHESKIHFDNTVSWGWQALAKPKAPTGLDTKVTLSGPAAAELGRQAGEVISLRWILNWGKDKL